jgi:hypothetical protein
MLSKALSLKPTDSSHLHQLKREICAMESQVDIFIKELVDISKDRSNLNTNHAIEFIRLRASLQRSMTNLELAHTDIELMQRSHHKLWKRFLLPPEEESTKNNKSAKCKADSTD